MRNAMTVDVEDYFQVSAMEPYVARHQWDEKECRVENNTHRILDRYAEAGVKATFFTLGWVAQRYPQLIRRIVDEGHELASHGWEHIRVTEQSRPDFAEDIRKTKALLEDMGGVAVRGYRAASYSIGAKNLWALEELAAAGYDYSSSIYPVVHDLYGMPEAPRFAFKPTQQLGLDCGELLEVPITTMKLGSRTMPCGGGGFFRLFPYALSKAAIAHVNKAEQQACIFYYHPWEIDPGQPRQPGISLKTRFRHYLNLERMEGRLQCLLDDFQWGRMDQIFLENA